MFARQCVERGLDHETAGGAADARIQPDRSLLLNRLPAQFGVAVAKFAAQESLEVRHFELFDQGLILRDGGTDGRQLHNRHDDFIDDPIEVRRNRRPNGGKEESGLIVDPIEREASLKGRN